MQTTSNTVAFTSEACETAILGKARWASRHSAVRRPRAVIEISDEQAAKITELLEELVSLARKMEATWAQIARDWSAFARSYADAVAHRDGDFTLPGECGETRRLRQTPYGDTQVDNRPRWK